MYQNIPTIKQSLFFAYFHFWKVGYKCKQHAHFIYANIRKHTKKKFMCLSV